MDVLKYPLQSIYNIFFFLFILIQIIYVALSTKGKFYEIEHSSSTQQQQQMFTKSSSGKGKQLNADCVHRISSIITDETIFPLNLKFISKHVNGLTHASIPGKIMFRIFGYCGVNVLRIYWICVRVVLL